MRAPAGSGGRVSRRVLVVIAAMTRSTEAIPFHPLPGVGGIMKKKDRYGWGIWLKDQREWAELPPRLCKPTTHNCNLVPALIEVMQRLASHGHDPELKQIPRSELIAMRAQHKETR